MLVPTEYLKYFNLDSAHGICEPARTYPHLRPKLKKNSNHEQRPAAILSVLVTTTAAVMTPVSLAQCPIIRGQSTILMQQMRTRHSMALRGNNSMSRTGSPTTLRTTRLLRLPCAGGFLPSIQRKKRCEVVVVKSDSDAFDRDFLFDSPPSRKRGFQRPRKPW